ncbi:MAG TPA: bifunctional 5,10-methylenetetrahydrofolate dehydrogenase/5,10-methenyltetrahydrofolate cyclohydrolase [Patescibacteria group bacterium]|jgi:methylenetetrahydrofolate dehydrogenase (NADP+)/methenyltetrahydrofolate cyclohydrolase|nr:bifunctional 5,10-methylenetetrahydrofolate dehydrogenase/5,10-methenyltetrahydrofolate cyclohydrolase [Patescibacteria group bacterium]
MKIDGRAIASNILGELKIKVLELKKRGIIPTMAVILIGNEESSNVYVRQKELKAQEIGATVKIFRFDETVTNEELEALIKKLDADQNIHGIILQRPAPAKIEVERLEELISRAKEIDGFGKDSLYTVPVAAAVFKILGEVFGKLNESISFNEWLKSQNIVAIGKGETAGQPIIDYLHKRGLEPIVVDSKTENINATIKNADIIISAIGKRGAIDFSGLKKDVILIGVGLSSDDEGKTRGDYNEDELEQVASFYTPTPGGVGPVNVAFLLENLVEATENLST